MPATETKRNISEGVSFDLQSHPPIALDKFREAMGVSPVTMWRFRRDGFLRTINLCGRHYVPYAAAIEFKNRAEKGEFGRQFANPAENEAKAKAKRATRKRKPAKLTK